MLEEKKQKKLVEIEKKQKNLLSLPSAVLISSERHLMHWIMLMIMEDCSILNEEYAACFG